MCTLCLLSIVYGICLRLLSTVFVYGYSGLIMADLEAIKERFDLATEIEKDLGQPNRGRWRCPFCQKNGGKSYPFSVHGQGYKCFGCDRKGDIITWLMDYRGLSWADLFDLEYGGVLPPAQPRPAAPPPAPSAPPCAAWQVCAHKFIDWCELQLWQAQAPIYNIGGDLLNPLEYLHWRGLKDETIRRYHLGYNPKPIYTDPASWGFDLAAWVKDHQDSKNPDKLWIPQGITVPHQAGGELWAVNIRRPAGDPKYLKITGSKAALFGADNLRGAEFILLTEGEFDAMLADQLTGDVCGVATLGSAGSDIDIARWGVYLLPARAILAALDLDPAGRRGLARLAAHSPQIHPVRVPALRAGDKDITDYHQAGGDLWGWLKYTLDRLGLLPCAPSPFPWPAGRASMAVRWPAASGMPVITRLDALPDSLNGAPRDWRRLEDGRIEATYDQDGLTLAWEIGCALGMVDSSKARPGPQPVSADSAYNQHEAMATR